MSQQKSLADQLVSFMRISAEASTKIDALPRDGDLWPQLGMLLEQQERAVREALMQAEITAYRLDRLAAAVTKQEPAA